MDFYTRQRYDDVQNTGAEAQAMRRWRRASRRYHDRLNSLLHLLPPGAGTFVTMSFHDAIALSIRKTARDLLIRMDVRGTEGWIWPRALIRFEGLLRCDDIRIMKGQMWQYEEINLGSDGHVVLNVLTRDQEWSIVAADIIVDAKVPLSKLEIIEWMTDIVQNDRSLKEVADIAEPLAPMRLDLLRMLRRNRFDHLEHLRIEAEEVIQRQGLVSDPTPAIIEAIQSWVSRSHSAKSDDPTAQA